MFGAHHPFWAPSHMVGRTLLIFCASSLIKSCSSAVEFELRPSFSRFLSLFKHRTVFCSFSEDVWSCSVFLDRVKWRRWAAVTSEWILLLFLKSAGRPVGQWRHVQCRLPSERHCGQELRCCPRSPPWLLLLLLWNLQRQRAESDLLNLSFLLSGHCENLPDSPSFSEPSADWGTAADPSAAQPTTVMPPRTLSPPAELLLVSGELRSPAAPSSGWRGTSSPAG